MALNENGFIDRVALRHSVSEETVRTVLTSLKTGGGRMAQFSHADFGGMSQWSSGMTMIGVSDQHALFLCEKLSSSAAS